MRVRTDEIEYDESGYHLYQGKPFTGEAVEMMSDGRILSLTSFRNGREEGADKSWHPNGQPRHFGENRGGNAVGTHHRWHENGVPERETIFDEQGNIIRRQEWDANGTPLDRRINSESIYIDQNTKLYTYGISPFSGESIETLPDGRVISIITIRNGLKDGPFRTWYESGQLKSEGQHHKGLPTGVYLEWHENGQLTQETTYDQHGKIVSIQKWDEKGNPLASKE